MARKYYTLLMADPVWTNGKWTIVFGDYDRATVKEEQLECAAADRMFQSKSSRYKIICTNPKQADIQSAVDQLNSKVGHNDQH